MKNLFGTVSMACSQTIFKASEAMKKHRKALSFSYVLALLFTCCLPAVAHAAKTLAPEAGQDFEMWNATYAILDIIFTVMIIVGIIVGVVGIILILIARFNEQSMTGPIITAGVGIGLILIRILVGTVLCEIAFEQMYSGWEYNGMDTQPSPK